MSRSNSFGSVLEGWRLGGLADDFISCVSELVANVYEHAAKSATAELLVSWMPGHSLTVEVREWTRSATA